MQGPTAKKSIEVDVELWKVFRNYVGARNLSEGIMVLIYKFLLERKQIEKMEYYGDGSYFEEAIWEQERRLWCKPCIED
jgi:hypothetical protein